MADNELKTTEASTSLTAAEYRQALLSTLDSYYASFKKQYDESENIWSRHETKIALDTLAGFFNLIKDLPVEKM